MEPFRTRGLIPGSKIDLWRQAFRSIRVSTTRPNARPHSVPVWYTWDGRNYISFQRAICKNPGTWHIHHGLACTPATVWKFEEHK